MLAVTLLLIGIMSRFIVHAPNFTPVVALALFGGMFLKKEKALWMPLAMMVISDLFLGLHEAVLFTWGSVLLISLLGQWEKSAKSLPRVFGKSIAAAVLFFAVTNFGAWLTMYPLTMDGFVRCYMLAIPFFRNTLVSTVVYSGVFFGVYEMVARRVRDTKLAWIAA